MFLDHASTTSIDKIFFNGKTHGGVFLNGKEHKEAWMVVDGELQCVWRKNKNLRLVFDNWYSYSETIKTESYENVEVTVEPELIQTGDLTITTTLYTFISMEDDKFEAKAQIILKSYRLTKEGSSYSWHSTASLDCIMPTLGRINVSIIENKAPSTHGDPGYTKHLREDKRFFFEDFIVGDICNQDELPKNVAGPAFARSYTNDNEFIAPHSIFGEVYSLNISNPKKITSKIIIGSEEIHQVGSSFYNGYSSKIKRYLYGPYDLAYNLITNSKEIYKSKENNDPIKKPGYDYLEKSLKVYTSVRDYKVLKLIPKFFPKWDYDDYYYEGLTYNEPLLCLGNLLDYYNFGELSLHFVDKLIRIPDLEAEICGRTVFIPMERPIVDYFTTIIDGIYIIAVSFVTSNNIYGYYEDRDRLDSKNMYITHFRTQIYISIDGLNFDKCENIYSSDPFISTYSPSSSDFVNRVYPLAQMDTNEGNFIISNIIKCDDSLYVYSNRGVYRTNEIDIYSLLDMNKWTLVNSDYGIRIKGVKIPFTDLYFYRSGYPIGYSEVYRQGVMSGSIYEFPVYNSRNDNEKIHSLIGEIKCSSPSSSKKAYQFYIDNIECKESNNNYFLDDEKVHELVNEKHFDKPLLLEAGDYNPLTKKCTFKSHWNNGIVDYPSPVEDSLKEI